MRAELIGLCIAAGVAWSHRFVALETNFVAGLVMTTIALAVRARWIAAAGACAIAGLIRPDAYVIGLPLGLLCIADLRASCWKPTAVGLTISAPWFVFATWYFGSPIPQSATAKVATLDFASYATWLFNYPAMNLVARRLSLAGLEQVPDLAAVVVWALAAVGAWLSSARTGASGPSLGAWLPTPTGTSSCEQPLAWNGTCTP